MKKIINSVLVAVLLSYSCLAIGRGDLPEKQPHGYVCPPCYHVKDIRETEVYAHDGQCPVCGMNLVERHTYHGDVSPLLHTGSGNFYLRMGKNRQRKPVSIFYHKPKNFGPDSRILLVVPGAGRDAWGYRDNWVEVSETHNVLILSPAYPEEDYDFAGYHLGGVVSSIEFTNYSTEKSEGRINKYIVRSDRDIVLGKITDSEERIFQDFDRIFAEAVAATGSNREKYDIFGHSAGGQILHRMALFYPHSKADRIIAANSGQYTLPNNRINFPFGLGGTEIKTGSYQDFFAVNLTVLVGEKDDENESRGTLLFTPTLNQQGLGRLSRARYFYKIAQQQAEQSNTKFNWRLRVVDNTGHDSRQMSKAAAQILYGG
ncbi:hypothetical protein [Microbulbifer magnicolonia]|uniref:hypothetical protein n=1 Tax=Microbulbifer magnicolonia TaxID=3109744 RepID=UPI002B40D53A|nr:hypothetical protein [Microbulbifer sp. GG15]